MEILDSNKIQHSFKNYVKNYSQTLMNIKRELKKDTMYNIHKCKAILNLE